MMTTTTPHMTRKYNLIPCLVLLSCSSLLMSPVYCHEEVSLVSRSKDNGNSNLRRKTSVDIDNDIDIDTDTAQRRMQSTDPNLLEKEDDEYFLNLVQRMKPHFFEIESREDDHDHEKEDKHGHHDREDKLGHHGLGLRKKDKRGHHDREDKHGHPNRKDKLDNHDSDSKSVSKEKKFISPPPKQFFHLHHMKTGGTSLSSYINCAIRRYTRLYNAYQSAVTYDRESEQTKPDHSSHKQILKISQYKLSECSKNSYNRCISQPENSCRNSIAQATVMTYCAPLAIANHLDWSENTRHHDEAHIQTYSKSKTFEYEAHTHNPTPSVTMLRNPVDRVWSMYRFQTRSCYQCKSLIDVYKDIDTGNKTYIEEQYGTGVCVPQLVNHFTRNLLFNLTLDELADESKIAMTDEEKVRDAIHSIRHRFTVVGIIEKLEESLKLFEYSFPWMSSDIGESDYYQDWKYQNVTIPNIQESDMKCIFPHANASPQNNRCGEKYTNMELPDHPDEETRKVILEHNLLDMKVYQAALEHFELQKRAMNWEEEAEEDLE